MVVFKSCKLLDFMLLDLAKFMINVDRLQKIYTLLLGCIAPLGATLHFADIGVEYLILLA